MARTSQDLAEVADALTGPTLQFSGDVRDPGFNDEVADQTAAAWGGVDVWIGNAGISPLVAGPLDTSPEIWREVIDVNLTGAFFGARSAARVMGPGGRIIFTGSVLGERPSKGLAAYSASKAGLVGMAKALALDLAPLKITVNVVAPGWFESPLAGPWMRRDGLSKTILDHTALNRWGLADLAGAFQFLASDAAEFVTGTDLTSTGVTFSPDRASQEGTRGPRETPRQKGDSDGKRAARHRDSRCRRHARHRPVQEAGRRARNGSRAQRPQ